MLILQLKLVDLNDIATNALAVGRKCISVQSVAYIRLLTSDIKVVITMLSVKIISEIALQ